MTTAGIAIAGAGMTGAYLYRRLVNRGIAVDIYDFPPSTACGTAPCAWGTSKGFHAFLAAADRNAEHYIRSRLDYVCIDDVTLPAELMTIDKPRLIRDLLDDARVIEPPLPFAEYDRIVDATGSGRALLPAIEDDLVLECIQHKVRSKSPRKNRIQLTRIGYAWCFPLGEDFYHIGCGSHVADPVAVLRARQWYREVQSGAVCGCRGSIRLTSPHRALPFVADRGKVWGVGEAIGCVAPLAGDGILPGMISASLLLANWDHPDRYTEAVLERFGWMETERRVLDRLRYGKRLRLSDARVLQRNSRRMGMRIGLPDALRLLEALAR